MFSCTVNIDGVEHKMQTLALAAEDLDEPLRRFGMYLRKKALAKYEAQAFAPLADSTIKKRASKGMHAVERKLAKDVTRARRKAGAGQKGVFAELAASNSRGVRNRLAVLAEFQSRYSRMHEGRRNGVMAAAGDLQRLTLKQAAGLDARVHRAVEKAINKPILGGLTKTLSVDVSGGTMTLESRTHGTWSDVHNEGGTAGHGAKIPERKTLELESHDIQVLISILKSHLLLAFEDGMQGPGF